MSGSKVTGDAPKTDLVSRMARMGHAMLPGMSSEAQQAPQHHASPAPHAHMEMSVPGGSMMNQEVPAMMTSSSVHPHPGNSPHQPNPQPQVYNNMGSFTPHRPSTPTYHVTPHHAQMQMTSQLQNMPMTSHPQNVPYATQQYQVGPQAKYLDTQQGLIPQASMQSTLDASQHQYAPYSNQRPLQHYNPSPTHGSDFFPILITESRQHSSELRSLQGKLDKVTELVDEVKKNTLEKSSQQGDSAQSMEANQIMHSVQRILHENERLKDQLLDKTKQIESQNDKISELLQQNQKHVEKSNLILEQRNDTFKESFEQSQARSLQLEQDKVQLTEKLSDATSRISELTQDLSNAKQREGELKQKFKDLYMKEKDRADEAEEKVKELEESLSSAQENEASRGKNEEIFNSKIREMKQKMQEILDEKNTKIEELSESLGQREVENKKLKNQMDLTVEELRAKIKNLSENSSAATSHSTQLQTENEELQKEVSTLKNSAQEFLEAQKELENKLEISVQRFGQLRTAYAEQREKLEELNEELEEANLYKERFERLKGQATSMKQKYDERINQLQSELEEQVQDAPQKSESSTNPDQLIAEVKKIMNSIFQRVKSQISSDEEYEGSEILNLMVQIIKTTTLELINAKQVTPPEEAESEQSSSDEGEETSDKPAQPSREVRTEAEPRVTQAEPKKVAVCNDAEQTVTEPEPIKDGVCNEAEHPEQEVIDAEEKDNEPVSTEPEQEPVKLESNQGEAKKEESSSDSEVKDVASLEATDLRENDKVEEKSETTSEAEPPEIMETSKTEMDEVDKKPQVVPPASNEDVGTSDVVPDDVIINEISNDPLQVVSENREDKKDVDEQQQEDANDPLSVSTDEKTVQEVADATENNGKEQEIVCTAESGDKAELTEGKPDEENSAAKEAKDESKPSMNQMITDTILNQIRVGREQDDDATSLSRSSSIIDDRQPPPLFDDDDDDDDDLDWLK